MESRSSFVILLVIIAILTLTLAVMVGYIFLVSGSEQNKTDSSLNSEIQRIPDKDLAVVNLFEENNFFNLKSNGDTKIIQISAQLKYRKSVKGIKNVDEKVKFNLGKVKEIFGTYFQGLTVDDIKKSGAKEKANTELVKKVNEYLLSNEKRKNDIVYEIEFDKWFYQE